MSNYICLTSSKLSRYKQYMYVDCKNYLADDLFIKNKITVKFEGDFTKDNSDYIFHHALEYQKLIPSHVYKNNFVYN